MLYKFLFFIILLLSPSFVSALDFNLGEGSSDITLEVAVRDTSGKDLFLPLKMIWQNEERNNTFAIVNFLENNFVSVSKKIPRTDVNGYLIFDTSTQALSQDRQILDQRYNVKVNYNFWWSSNTKSELFYVILEREWEFYKVVDFYSQADKEEADEVIINSTQVKINGTVEGTFFSKKDIGVGLYNERGERLYIDYTDREGNFEIDLSDFQSTLELDTTYYLIYGKFGDVEEEEIGYLYKSIPFSFWSYIQVVEEFEEPISLKVEPNIKDQVISQPFPYIFFLILLSLYLYISHKYIIKKLIRKMFIHPFQKEYRIIYNKRKDLIETIIKNNLWKKS